MNALESLFDELKIQKLINVSKILPNSEKINLSFEEAESKATFLILMNSELADVYYKSHQKHRFGLELKNQSNQLASSVILIILVLLIWIFTYYLFHRKEMVKYEKENGNFCCPGHFKCCDDDKKKEKVEHGQQKLASISSQTVQSSKLLTIGSYSQNDEIFQDVQAIDNPKPKKLIKRRTSLKNRLSMLDITKLKIFTDYVNYHNNRQNHIKKCENISCPVKNCDEGENILGHKREETLLRVESKCRKKKIEKYLGSKGKKTRDKSAGSNRASSL